MITDFLPIVALLIITSTVTVSLLFMSGLFGPATKEEHKPRKLMPYESGMEPIGPAVRRLPIKFYLFAVLFILFDIEVIFFLPWAVVFRQLGFFALVEMFIFIVILLVGYIYAWRTGALEWE